MAVPLILAAMMAKGIKDGVSRTEERDRDATEERAFKSEERVRQRKRWAEEDALRSDIGKESAPAMVESGGVAGSPLSDAEGIPMSPTPAARVNGRQFPTMADAQTAAQDYDAPKAVNGRIVATMRKHGKPLEALQTQGAANQAAISSLQLNAAEEAEVNRRFDAQVDGLKGWDDMTGFMTSSAADGVGGKAKFRHQIGPDGKVRLMASAPDGREAELPHKFSNDAAGVEAAKLFLKKGATTKDRLDHLYKQSQDERKREVDDRKHQLDVDEHNAKKAYYEGVVGAASTRAEKAGGGGGAFERMSEADKLTYQGLLRTQQTIEDEITKAQTGGMWVEKSDNARALRARLAALELRSQDLIGRYAGDGGTAPDPLNLRRPPAAPDAAATAAPPRGGMDAVMASMQRNGDTAADVQIGGRPLVRMSRPGAAPAAPIPQAATPPNQQIDAKAAREVAEMGNATRMQFSPDVAAYLQQKKAAEEAAAAEANTRRSASMAAQENARRKQLGY